MIHFQDRFKINTLQIQVTPIFFLPSYLKTFYLSILSNLYTYHTSSIKHHTNPIIESKS